MFWSYVWVQLFISQQGGMVFREPEMHHHEEFGVYQAEGRLHAVEVCVSSGFRMKTI